MQQIYGLPPVQVKGGLTLYPVCVSLSMGPSHGTTIAHYFHLSSIDDVLVEEDAQGAGVAQIGEFEDEFFDERNSETALGAYIDDSFSLALLRRYLTVDWLMSRVNNHLDPRGLVISAPKLINAS